MNGKELSAKESRELVDELFRESILKAGSCLSIKEAMIEDSATEGGLLVSVPNDLMKEALALAGCDPQMTIIERLQYLWQWIWHPLMMRYFRKEFRKSLDDYPRIPKRSLKLPLTKEASSVKVDWLSEEES